MGSRSTAKGKVGEREAAEALSSAFPNARRCLVQSRDGAEPDLLDTEPYHVEVKRQARPNILAAMRQATENAEGTGRVPVAMTRADGGQWLITMRAADWCSLVATKT